MDPFPSALDRVYHHIITHFIETGHAPHYTEAAVEMEMDVEDARNKFHELMVLGIPGLWLFPDTDYISTFAPFSSLPTQYRISVDGEQKWFGQ